MIVVIVISGILLGIVGMFGRRQIDAYVDIRNRADLVDAADTALRRMGRDLQAALGNSVRVSGDTVLEFVPIKDAGLSRTKPDGSSGDPLVSGSADTSFDVLGPAITVESGDQLVFSADPNVYAGASRKSVNTGNGQSKLTFSPAGITFDPEISDPRFQIVGGPVSYRCVPNVANPEEGVIYRHWCYDFQGTQPTVFTALGVHASASCSSGVQTAILVKGVYACTFRKETTEQGSPLVILRLTLSRNGEPVELLHQVGVMNTP